MCRNIFLFEHQEDSNFSVKYGATLGHHIKDSIVKLLPFGLDGALFSQQQMEQICHNKGI